jgi:WXG100 family type VII secretion target
MAMILKVTPDEVRTKAKEIEAQKNQLQNLMQAMQQEVNKLPADYWKSQSGTDYGSKYQSVQKNCQGSLDTLMQHITNLVDAANKYDEVERSQAQKVNALNTNNIFN